jgi:hypothetical protein
VKVKTDGAQIVFLCDRLKTFTVVFERINEGSDALKVFVPQRRELLAGRDELIPGSCSPDPLGIGKFG